MVGCVGGKSWLPLRLCVPSGRFWGPTLKPPFLAFFEVSLSSVLECRGRFGDIGGMGLHCV